MKVSIVTPDRAVFDGEAISLTLPGTNGSFQIFENHAAMISSLGKGDMRLKTSDSEESYEIEGGAVEVNRNKVTVLVESIF